MSSITTGNSNLALGSASLRSTTDGAYNIGLGIESLVKNTSGYNNTVIGYKSGLEITTTYDNTIIGYSSGFKTTGFENTFIGSKAGGSTTAGSENVIIGYNAVNSPTVNNTGLYNVILGNKSAINLEAGQSNIAIGYQSFGIPNGNNNIAIGNSIKTSYTPTVADYNIGIGGNNFITLSTNLVSAGQYPIGNISIGYDSAKNVTQGGGNIYIGYGAGSHHIGAASPSTSTVIAIGSGSMGNRIANQNISIGHGAANNVVGTFNISIGNNSFSGQSQTSAAQYNTLIGNSTGASITSGDSNTGIGYNVLASLTTGVDNVVIGSQAGANATTAFTNVIIGTRAGDGLTSVSASVLIGTNAGGGSLTGHGNVFVGTNSGLVATSATKNVFIGMFAGDSVQTATGSVLIGHDAGASLTTQGRNVFIGENTGDSAAVSSSILIGSDAGGGSLTGHGNVFIGESTGLVATSATKNVFVGNRAGDAVTTSTGSVLIGDNAGDALTSGNNNIFIGELAGSALTTGDRNIFIGRRAGHTAVGLGVAPANDGFNNIVIGNNVGLFAAGTDNSVVIGGQNSAAYYVAINAVQWNNVSDQNDKADIANLGLGLDLIRQIQPKKYRWDNRSRYQNAGSKDGSLKNPYDSWGIIAQDLVALTASFASMSYLLDVSSGSYLDETYYTTYLTREASLLWPTVQAVKDLDGITAKTGSNAFTGSQSISGSQFITGSLTLTRPRAANSVGLDLYGNGTRGGSQYFDFLRVTNTTGSATTPSKTFRLDGSGRIEIVNDAYNTLIFTLNDSGSLSLPGTSAGSLSGFKNTGGGLSISNGNTVIFDDGNMHIHSTNPDTNMWINASGSGNVVINGQTGAAGGLLIGTSTKTGYVTINGSAVYNLGSYGYLTSAGATGTSSGTANYSLVADNRIAASEFNAYSDERLKDIIDNVSVNEATKFILNTHPIKFTWKDSGDGGIKVGYSAQEVMKAGFDNLVGVMPNESLEEHIDADGFVSPSGSQLTVNYEQIIPYHSVVIKHLLEKIEELQKEIQELKGK